MEVNNIRQCTVAKMNLSQNEHQSFFLQGIELDLVLRLVLTMVWIILHVFLTTVMATGDVEKIKNYKLK